MKNQVFCVWLATILAACATAEQPARQLAEENDDKCGSYGVQPGRPA